MKRLLVVDDDATFLGLAQAALGGEFEVTSAQDRAQALRLAAGTAPDVVFLDARMPGPGLVETLRELGGRGQGLRTPVVVLSASRPSAALRALLRLEPAARGFLDKLAGVRAWREAALAAAA